LLNISGLSGKITNIFPRFFLPRGRQLRKILILTIFPFLIITYLHSAKVCQVDGAAGTVKAIYPVGAIYISTSGTNPATLFGFGTWEVYGQGRAIVGAGSGTDSRGESKSFSAGAIGGEYNHQLTVAEMPSHSHNLAGSAWQNAFTDGLNIAYSIAGRNMPRTGWYSGFMSDAGGGDAHNNVQPYIAIYIWRRAS
jgi:hypothetical protein